MKYTKEELEVMTDKQIEELNSEAWGLYQDTKTVKEYRKWKNK